MASKRKYSVALEIKGKDLASSVISKLSNNLQRLAAPLRWISSLGKSFGGFLEKLPGISILGRGVANLAGGMRDLALATASYAGTLDDLRAATGLGTRQIQQVAYAAEHAGVPFDQFAASLRKMTEVVGRGVTGKQFFATLGRGARAFAGALTAAKTPAQKFELVLSQMAALSDPTKRAAFAIQFFGEAGVKLASSATDGAGGLKAMRLEAERLGLVMSDEEVKRADRFGDAWADLTKVFESGKRDFGAGLIEGLLPGLEDLLSTVKGNRAEFGRLLKTIGKDVGKGIIDAAKWTVEAVKWISANSGKIIKVAEKVGIALAALSGIRLLGGTGAILGGLGGALGTGKGGGLLAGLLGGWKVALGALVAGTVVMMGKALAQVFTMTTRTPEQQREDKLLGGSGGSDAGRARRIEEATLFGALPGPAQSPNKRELSPREAAAWLQHGRAPVGFATMTDEDKARRDAYLDAAGFTRTWQGLDSINSAARDPRSRSPWAGHTGDWVTQRSKIEVEIKVDGTDASNVNVKSSLPKDVEAKVSRANVGKRTMDHLKGGR